VPVLNLGEPTPIRIVYEVVRLHRGAWVPLFTGTSRYAAMSAYNNTEPPKRVSMVHATGGQVIYQDPENGESNPTI
jgi:hypothetical protein